VAVAEAVIVIAEVVVVVVVVVAVMVQWLGQRVSLATLCRGRWACR
jgi:hypothetical protein